MTETYIYTPNEEDELAFHITHSTKHKRQAIVMLDIFIGYIYRFDITGKEEYPSLFNIIDYGWNKDKDLD